MKTWNAKNDEVEQKWWLVDASNKTLGRLASQIAKILRGKHKPQFTPHVDTGDFVVVINADKVKMTGKKWTQKIYYSHSGFIGSVKETSADELRRKDPTGMLDRAVVGMLPKNKLSRRMITKLKTYKGAEHPHSAQKPQALDLN